MIRARAGPRNTLFHNTAAAAGWRGLDWITENYLPGTVVIKRPEYLLTVTAEVTPDHTRHEDRDSTGELLRSQYELNME